MLNLKELLTNVDYGPDIILSGVNEENDITSLKEMAEHGVCSMPKYIIYDKQFNYGGELLWKCDVGVKVKDCYDGDGGHLIEKEDVGYGTSKQIAKRKAAYNILQKI